MDTMQQIIAALEAGEPVGWQVLDPDGNVVASGPVSYAELSAEALGE